jgi:hypothetical protein
MGDKDIDRPITHRDRVRVQFYTEKGQVAVIHVIQYEARFNDEWVPVARYDCAHGFFHRDICHADGRQDKEALFFNSLADALNYAVRDIKENWEQYRARYEAELESRRGGK